MDRVRSSSTTIIQFLSVLIGNSIFSLFGHACSSSSKQASKRERTQKEGVKSYGEWCVLLQFSTLAYTQLAVEERH